MSSRSFVRPLSKGIILRCSIVRDSMGTGTICYIIFSHLQATGFRDTILTVETNRYLVRFRFLRGRVDFGQELLITKEAYRRTKLRPNDSTRSIKIASFKLPRSGYKPNPTRVEHRMDSDGLFPRLLSFRQEKPYGIESHNPVESSWRLREEHGRRKDVRRTGKSRIRLHSMDTAMVAGLQLDLSPRCDGRPAGRMPGNILDAQQPAAEWSDRSLCGAGRASVNPWDARKPSPVTSIRFIQDIGCLSAGCAPVDIHHRLEDNMHT
jgi:hypothetical protein